MAGAAALSTMSAGATLSGCTSSGPASGMKLLRPEDVELLRALTPAVMKGKIAPGDAAAIDQTLQSFDTLLVDLSEPVVAGVHQAFDVLSFGLTRGLTTGQWSAWSKASLEDAESALARLRDSSIGLLNAIYSAVIRLIISCLVPHSRERGDDGVPRSAQEGGRRRARRRSGRGGDAVTDLSTITFGTTTDPYNKAAERGWDITDASQLTSSLELEADVVIVGTGAGGGTAAETLSKAGLSVVLLEAGPLKTSSQFDMQERAAYRDLYQEGTGRGTKDGGMVILQGRSVGGSTTVNWTTSFRTPPETLKFWAEHMGVSGCSVEEMAPYFEHMEERLNIHKWPQAPNNNNAMLQRAAEKLGYPWATIRRNVRGCLNLGYCGLGCPVDAKQSMLVTTIPGALDNKAKLVHRARVVRILRDGDVVEGRRSGGSDFRCQRRRPGRRSRSGRRGRSWPAARSIRPRSCCGPTFPIRTDALASERSCTRRR